MSVDFADFVHDELQALEIYDSGRPAGHPYAFHLHVQRVADDMRRLALAMDMDAAWAETLYLAALAHDAGKRLLPVALWDMEGKPSDADRALRRTHTQLGVTIVDDVFGAANHDPFLDLMRDMMLNHHECMDGSGHHGLTGDDLSLEARMLCVCDAFDGYSAWRPHFGGRDLTPPAVIARMQGEKAGQFDADILAVFARLKA